MRPHEGVPFAKLAPTRPGAVCSSPMGGGLAVAAFHDASFQGAHLRTRSDRSDQPYDRIIADDNPEVPATERPDRAPADEGSGVRHGVVYIRFS